MKISGWMGVMLSMAAFGFCAADDIVFSEGFDTPEAVAKYRPGDGISFVPEGGAGGGGCIRFHRDTVGDSWLLIPIDPVRLRGRAVQVEAMMKAEKIAKPSPGYMGPKLMLNLQSPGENSHSEQEKVHGTYDWRKFQVFAQAASDVEKAVLPSASSTDRGRSIWWNVKITLVPTGETEAFVPPAAPLPTRTKYRGMRSGYDLREADIPRLRARFRRQPAALAAAARQGRHRYAGTLPRLARRRARQARRGHARPEEVRREGRDRPARRSRHESGPVPDEPAELGCSEPESFRRDLGEDRPALQGQSDESTATTC